jgi:hypothetical protein
MFMEAGVRDCWRVCGPGSNCVRRRGKSERGNSNGVRRNSDGGHSEQ